MLLGADAPSTPGIYAIINIVDQKFYIGSSVNLIRYSDKLDLLATYRE